METLIKFKIRKTLYRWKRFFVKRYLHIRNKSWVFFYKRIKPYFTKTTVKSDLPIDVVILAIDKDAETLPHVVQGVRRNVKHPISNIFVISPVSSIIKDICLSQGCFFVNERTLLDIDPDQLNITIKGTDRSKWYYQQLLKWSCDKILKETHYLVVDADTIFIRPQTFERKGELILNLSDEYHRPYFENYRKLMGENPKNPTSFICHHMLFSRSTIKELKEVIEEENGFVWYQSIINSLDLNQGSGFSEYETYGNYMFSHYRSGVLLEYWYNKSLSRNFLQTNSSLERLYGRKFKSISFDSWYK